MEKRIPEASALRGFFHDQWEIIQNLISESRIHKLQQQRRQQRLSDAVEHIVDRVDNRIRGVSSYRHKLRSSAQILLLYVQDLVTKIPEPITINRDSYLSTPLINAMFSSVRELEGLLINSTEVRGYVDARSQDIYALLFVQKEQKKILGKVMRGELIQSDVQQTAVSFYGHRIVAPAGSEVETYSHLERFLFENIVSSIRSHMVRLRHEQVMQEGERAALRPEQNMNNPETYLRVLTEQLSKPKRIVSLQNNRLRVSKMGILLSADSRESSNEFELNELAIGGSNFQAVSLIKFDISEWLP